MNIVGKAGMDPRSLDCILNRLDNRVAKDLSLDPAMVVETSIFRMALKPQKGPFNPASQSCSPVTK